MNTTKFASALKDSAIQTISSTAAQSAITGDSFKDALKLQLTNLVINASGQLIANEIGNLAHETKIIDNQGNQVATIAPQISKPTQLTLHAALGCGMAAASGSDCAAGAAAGITGELSAEFLDQNTNLTNAQILEAAKIASALAAAAVAGPDDGASVFVGSQIGRNAAENNYLSPKEKGDLVKELKACGSDIDCKESVQAKYQAISDPRDKQFERLYDDCKGSGNCVEFNKIHYDLRMEWTREGNEYFLTNASEFERLPNYQSIFHTYTRDSQGNVNTFGQNDNVKYIHPIYGYEVVLDSNNNIVMDHLNIGTYNFYNPSMQGLNKLLDNNFSHNKFDVSPYYPLGNAKDDPTSSTQRRARWLQLGL